MFQALDTVISYAYLKLDRAKGCTYEFAIAEFTAKSVQYMAPRNLK